MDITRVNQVELVEVPKQNMSRKSRSYGTKLNMVKGD